MLARSSPKTAHLKKKLGHIEFSLSSRCARGDAKPSSKNRGQPTLRPGAKRTGLCLYKLDRPRSANPTIKKEINMSTTPSQVRGLDNRIKSVQNEEKVLHALHRFGWLPVRQVAAFCWPNDATPRSAQRTLQQLLAKKHVLFKDGPDGSRVYTMTAPGARRVRDTMGLDATVDTEFARRIEHSYLHRCLANDVCLWWARAQADNGGSFYTEHEVVTGRAPVRAAPIYMSTAKGKIPDGILSMNAIGSGNVADEKWLGWVEVERGHKNKDDHLEMIGKLCDVLALGTQRWEIGVRSVLKFAVVVCPREAHERRLVEGMLEFLAAHRGTYNTSYAVSNLHIWRPASGDGISVREWIDERPEMLILRDKLKLWWAPVRVA